MALGLLVVGIGGALARPARLPASVVPLIAAALVLATGILGWREATRAVEPLAAPLAFLLASVPLAQLLDRIGFFTAVAATVGGGPRLKLRLWWLGAAVTAVLNLDTAVVLLTPLYVRIARRHGSDPLELAVQPVLLAALASSALPVSNLTNLIAASHLGLRATDFLVHLGPATLAATTVGWFFYSRATARRPAGEPVCDPVDARALRRGAPVVAIVVAGFVLGDHVGLAPWAVAAGGCVVLLAMVDDRRVRLPVDATLAVLGLGVLARAAGPLLPVEALLSGTGAAGELRAGVGAIVGANLLNNLPALLVALGHLAPGDPRLWTVLLGLNTGPVLVLTGALAGILWRDTAARVGVPVSPWRYARLGARVGLPAIAMAFAVRLATHALVG